MKVLNKNFFHLIEKFRVLTQDDHMRKRRTTEERCCQCVRGWRIPQSLQSVEVLSGQIPSTKTCRRTELGLPALLPLSTMYTMKFWLRLKQSVSWFQSEEAFTIPKKDTYIFYCSKIRENAPDKVHDLRLVSREPQELFGSERVF